MKSILHLISSPRKEASVSTKLGKIIVERLQQKYPDSSVTEINLLEQDVPHLSADHLKAFYTPADQLSAADLSSISYSDAAIAQLMKADIIVIGSPMYNFTIHSSLKAWIDQITRAGVTFRYSEQGPEGLMTGKEVYLAVSSGGVYTDGPYAAYDFVVPYLKAMLGFLGMTNLTTYRVEGLNVPQLQENAFEIAVANIEI